MTWKFIETVKERDIYSCLSTDSKLDADVGSILYETDTGYSYEYNGNWYVSSSNGTSIVQDPFSIDGGTIHRRVATAVAGTNKTISYQDEWDIHTLRFTIQLVAAAAQKNEDAMLCVYINALDEADADAALQTTITESLAIQVPVWFLPLTVETPATITSSDVITRLDFIHADSAGSATPTFNVIVEAI